MTDNGTAIQEIFKKVDNFFTDVRIQVFLCWCIVGWNGRRSCETESNRNDLVSEYKQHQNATAHEEGEFDDEVDNHASGTVRPPHVPRKTLGICSFGDQNHVDEAISSV